MSEDIHNGDEQFRKAYEDSNEEPSADVWNKINADLDRQDAVYFRRKFVIWKYIACLLILLSSASIAYHTYFKKPGESGSVTQMQKLHITPFNNKPASPAGTTEQDFTTGKVKRPFQTQPDEKANLFPDTLSSASEDKNDLQPLRDIRKDRKQSFTKQQIDVSNRDNLKPDKKRVAGNQIPDSNEFVLNKKKSILSQQNNEETALKGKQKMKSILPEDSSFENDSANKSLEQRNNSIQNRDSDFLVQKNTPAKSPDSSSQQQAAITIKPRFARGWTIIPFASVDFMSYQLDDDDKHRGANEPNDRDDIEERENHEFSYSAGVMAMLQYTKKTGFKTGLQYSNISIGIQPQTLYADQDNNTNVSYKFVTSSGYAFVEAKDGSRLNPGDSTTSEEAEHHLQYLTFPLLVTYKVYANKKFSVDAGAGLAAHLLLGSKIETEIAGTSGKEEITLHKLQGLRNHYFSFVADASLQWRINQKLAFHLLPSFRYAIAPITKENIVKTYPYGFGIGAGIAFKL